MLQRNLTVAAVIALLGQSTSAMANDGFCGATKRTWDGEVVARTIYDMNGNPIVAERTYLRQEGVIAMSTVDEGEARNNKSNCKKAKEIARNCVNAIYDSMDPKPTGGVRRLLGADEFKAADWNGVNGVHSPTTMPGKQRKILSGSKYHVYGFVKTNEAWHTFDCGAF